MGTLWVGAVSTQPSLSVSWLKLPIARLAMRSRMHLPTGVLLEGCGDATQILFLVPRMGTAFVSLDKMFHYISIPQIFP